MKWLLKNDKTNAKFKIILLKVMLNMKLSFNLYLRVILFIFIVLLLGIAVVSEVVPQIERARAMFPEEFDNDYSCYDVLIARPWYGQLNYWFWLSVFIVPLLILSIRPVIAKWPKRIIILMVIGLCYLFLNLAVYLFWDIRNAPFHGEGIEHVNGVLVSSEEDQFKFHCFDIADGGSLVGAAILGWIPASLYVGFWLVIMRVFRRKPCDKKQG